DLAGLDALLLALGPPLPAAPPAQLGEVVQAPRQGVEVADGVGDGDGLAEPVAALLRLRGLDVGGADPLLQQADLGDERVELALEVGQGLFGRTGLPGPDDALTVGRPDVHGAVLVHPAPDRKSAV